MKAAILYQDNIPSTDISRDKTSKGSAESDESSADNETKWKLRYTYN